MRQVNQMRIGFGIILTVALIAGYGGMCSTSSSSDSGSSVQTDAKGITDTTFGTLGVVTTTIGSSASAYSLAIQPDGKIVAGGWTNNGSNNDFVLARYTATGALDTSFDTDGIVTTAIVAGLSDYCYDIALQPDGKILACGITQNGPSNDLVLARYYITGTLDAGFGIGGVITQTIGDYDQAYNIDLQASGKIILGGHVYDGSINHFFLTRYTSAGVLDTTFGGGDGVITTTIGSGNTYSYGMALQEDDKIILTGYTDFISGSCFALARYTADGALDTGFGGGDGVITTVIGTDLSTIWDYAYDLVVQPDGKILTLGYTWNPGNIYDIVLARYTISGTLDTGFGGGDGVVTATGSVTINSEQGSIALQSNGKILLGTSNYNGSSHEFYLTRLKADGALDTTFGTAGIVIMDLTANNDFIYKVLLQSNGYVVAGGSINNKFGLARLK